jgi:hypothetical protein
MLLLPQNKMDAVITGARAKWLARPSTGGLDAQALNPSMHLTRQPCVLSSPLPGALYESLKPPKNLPISCAISTVLATLYVRIAHFILDFSAHFRYHNGIVGVQQLTI